MSGIKISYTPTEIEVLIKADLKKRGFKTTARVQFSGTIKYGGTQYDPDLSTTFTGATVSITPGK